MKQSRTNVSIAISSIALLIVLIIQVNWIFKTAKIKEELFNEKANMVLSRTMDALRSDEETCRKIDACVELDGSPTSPTKLGQGETDKIDSLFNAYMKLYNFHIEYSFEVVKPNIVASNNQHGFANYIYNQPVTNPNGKDGFELKLIFPTKQQFIIAEMGPIFITSVVLILVVLVMFWRTIRSLIKEKRISEHTTDFLNNMTHEFKTPLTNIGLAGKMLLNDSTNRQGDKAKYYSGIIIEENEKLKLQVEQMLNMTALERGEIPLEKMKLDFDQLIQVAVKQMAIQMEIRQGEWQLKLNAKNSLVMGDGSHLINAISNLIDNAIKYSNGKPNILIQTYNDGESIVVVVSDNGIGIEREYLKKVFDKFFRVPTGDVHDVKGFGLGLAYIKKIVDLHGGIIELQSEVGKGATFTIVLPHV